MMIKKNLTFKYNGFPTGWHCCVIIIKKTDAIQRTSVLDLGALLTEMKYNIKVFCKTRWMDRWIDG